MPQNTEDFTEVEGDFRGENQLLTKFINSMPATTQPSDQKEADADSQGKMAEKDEDTQSSGKSAYEKANPDDSSDNESEIQSKELFEEKEATQNTPERTKPSDSSDEDKKSSAKKRRRRN